MKRSGIILLPAAALLALSAGLGIGEYRVRQARAEAGQAVGEIERRMELLQRKTAEEKAQKEQHLRERMTLEGERNGLRQELEQLQQQKQTVGADLGGKLRALESKLQDAERQNALLLSARSEGGQALNELKKHLADLGRQKGELEQEVETVKRRQQETAAVLDRCRSHNGRLTDLSRDLLDKYADKGIFKTLLEQEKFTGLKKVELEHFVQEYRDKIDAQKFKEVKR